MKSNEWLILIPTSLEANRLGLTNDHSELNVEICGFGPIVSAAKTARLIAERHPHRILLLGIAGSYSDELELGQAYQFERIRCHGVGVGTRNAFRSTAEIGWLQHESSPEIGNELTVAIHADAGSIRSCLQTVCAASANEADVEFRCADSDAEDMESFGVASAAALAGIPMHVIRGISNRAGDRDHNNWQIEAALNSAWQLARKTIGI